MWTSVFRAIGALTSGDAAERDFDLAAERIQTALLNVSLPEIAGLDLGVHAEPARLVGGDYIDVFAAEKQCLLFGLGDASGKSLAAALNALMLRYLVRGLVQALSIERLESVLTHTNAVVAQDLRESDQFITLLIGTIDAASGKMRIANAGHEPPLVLRAGAPDIEIMTKHDIVLGVDPKVTYAIEETTVGFGDRVVLYTDGLTEASNSRGELFTVERLRENLLAHRALTAQELADALFETVKAYAEGNMRDDATILVVHRVSA
ncbi:MAG: PP2C family protein-serine/threonine phosphatase [Candidatus Eremiobacteraeota bacterium]|nr:PP2C family protein-serine/threonine phosphatase [Candidatus Eremiobacteraeota bacterium]